LANVGDMSKSYSCGPASKLRVEKNRGDVAKPNLPYPKKSQALTHKIDTPKENERFKSKKLRQADEHRKKRIRKRGSKEPTTTRKKKRVVERTRHIRKNRDRQRAVFFSHHGRPGKEAGKIGTEQSSKKRGRWREGTMAELLKNGLCQSGREGGVHRQK